MERKRTTNVIVSTPQKASNPLFALLVICVIVVIGFLIFEEITKDKEANSDNNYNQQASISEMRSHIIAPSSDSMTDLIHETETEEVIRPLNSLSTPTASTTMQAKNAYPRTAYLLFDDKDYQHLVRATYVTKNLTPDDSLAVQLTKQSGRIVGYDNSTNNKIANIKDISNGQKFYDAKIVYRDKDMVLLVAKNKNNPNAESYLYCIKGFDGKLVWSVLMSSLVGINEKNVNVTHNKDEFILKSGNHQVKITNNGKIL